MTGAAAVGSGGLELGGFRGEEAGAVTGEAGGAEPRDVGRRGKRNGEGLVPVTPEEDGAVRFFPNAPHPRAAPLPAQHARLPQNQNKSLGRPGPLVLMTSRSNSVVTPE